MDLVVRADRMPAPGETVTGDSFVTVPGGKGANQAVAVARLGGRVAMIGCVGQDSFGNQLLESLREAGVDTRGMCRTSKASTGVAAILLDRKGENRIIAVPGANAHLGPDDLTPLETWFANAKLIVTQLEVTIPTIRSTVQLAIRHRIPVLLNPAPVCPLEDELLAAVDYLVLNETEAAVLTGIRPEDEEGCQQASQALHARGVPAVIITLGPRGAYVDFEGRGIHVPTQSVTVVDTTAAGDCFIGGLAVSLVEGRGLIEATHFACAAGTLAVTRLGAQTSIPTRGEVDAVLASAPLPEASAQDLASRPDRPD